VKETQNIYTILDVKHGYTSLEVFAVTLSNIRY